MRALALDRSRPTLYLTCHPLFWGVALTTLLGMSWLAGLVFGLVAAVAFVAIVFAAARESRIHEFLDRHARIAGWRRRCSARESTLDEIGIATAGLHEATCLVARLQVGDPERCQYLEVEELLDRYVELELVARRCELSLQHTRSSSTGVCSLSRQAIRERIAAGRGDLEERICAYRDELAAIPELLQLIILRGSLEAVAPAGDALGERLLLLPAEDELASALS